MLIVICKMRINLVFVIFTLVTSCVPDFRLPGFYFDATRYPIVMIDSPLPGVADRPYMV